MPGLGLTIRLLALRNLTAVAAAQPRNNLQKLGILIQKSNLFSFVNDKYWLNWREL